MYTCSKCGELLGDNATTCFNCKNTIQKEEVKEHIRDSERSIAQYECEIRNKYTKRLNFYMNFSIVAVILFLISWVLSGTEWADATFFLCPLALFILVILPYVLRTNSCPFCRSYLYDFEIGDFCPYCGKRYKNKKIPNKIVNKSEF